MLCCIFLGPVRPGMESDIPLPSGTPIDHRNRIPALLDDPQPMPVPDQNDDVFRDLQVQAMQHMQQSSSSPADDQLQQLAANQYALQVSAHHHRSPIQSQ